MSRFGLELESKCILLEKRYDLFKNVFLNREKEYSIMENMTKLEEEKKKELRSRRWILSSFE